MERAAEVEVQGKVRSKIRQGEIHLPSKTRLAKIRQGAIHRVRILRVRTLPGEIHLLGKIRLVKILHGTILPGENLPKAIP